MPETTAAPDADRYACLDALQAAHAELLDATDPEKLEAADVDRIRAFLRRAAATGAALDTAADRKEAQGLLDYWAASLYTASRLRKDNIRTGERLPADETVLAPFPVATAKATAATVAAWYAALPPAGQESARQLLMRLVRMPADGSAVAARPVLLSRLDVPPADAVERLLGGLEAAEAVTVTRPAPPEEAVVALCSEALTREWPVYAAWVSERVRFRAAAELWSVNRRREDYLGEQSVAEAENYHDRNTAENDFLRDSRAELKRLHDERVRHLEENNKLLRERNRARERAARRDKRLKLLAYAFAAGLLLALGAIVWAWYEEEKAENRAKARRGLAVRVQREGETAEEKLAEAYRHLAGGTRPGGRSAEECAAEARQLAGRIDFKRRLRNPTAMCPGTSIGRDDPADGSCGSICCIVRNPRYPGKRYLITAADAVSPPGSKQGLVQPAYLDAGPTAGGYSAPRESVAKRPEIDGTYRFAVAELLDATTRASNDIPGLGPIAGFADATALDDKDELVLVGCGSGRRTGRVVVNKSKREEKILEDNPKGTLLATRMSAPSDAGAPVVVVRPDGPYLVGFLLRSEVRLSGPADEDRSLIVPLGEILKSKGFELWRE